MNTLFIIATLFTGSYGVGIETCNYNDENTCLDNWPCAWCNKSTITNTTGCYKIPICGINEEIYNTCSINNKKVYSATCFISSTLFIILLVMGYYISMIVIFGKVNTILINEQVSDNVRKSINTIISIMTIVPLLLTFVFKPVTFYFLFCSYLITGCSVYLCVKTNKRVVVTEVNLEQQPPSYTEQLQEDTTIQQPERTNAQENESQPLL